MNNDSSIEIATAANGFIVRPTRTYNEASLDDDVKVFQTYEELGKFLAGHFTYRCESVSADKKSK